MTNYDEIDFSNAVFDVGKRKRYQRQAKSAGQLINHLMARTGIAQTQTSNEFQATWKQLVDARMQKYTMVSGMKRGVLEVIVANSSVSQRLQFDKSNLLKQLQEKFPKNKIRDLRFRVGSVDS